MANCDVAVNAGNVSEACRGGFQTRPPSAHIAREIFLWVIRPPRRIIRDVNATSCPRLLPQGGFETRPYMNLNPCASRCGNPRVSPFCEAAHKSGSLQGRVSNPPSFGTHSSRDILWVIRPPRRIVRDVNVTSCPRLLPQGGLETRPCMNRAQPNDSCAS